MSKLYIPTCIYQEENCVKKYGSEMKGLGKHAFIVTGKHSAKTNGSLADVQHVLREMGIAYTVFDEVEENPSMETCERARKAGTCAGVDFVIGIGGGSPLDAAKAIALLLANPSESTECFYQSKALGYLPVVQVPTTCGTGSEVTPYAILTIHAKRTKQSISHRIYPTLAFCDSRYLQSAPSSIIVNTAVDALCHLVESYFNTNSNCANRMYSTYGFKLWGKAKEHLLENTIDKEIGNTLMEASTYAGMAITHTGTSLPHALSYYLTYEMGIPHGKACGIFLAGYLDLCRKNMPQEGDKVLELLGITNGSAFADLMEKLIGARELSHTEISEDIRLKAVEGVMANPNKLKNCPFKITEKDLWGMF